jgi:hypothetical protein
VISTPRLLAAAVLLLVLPTSQPVASAGAAEAGARREPAPGTAGIGDPYFPRDGNGGIDVQRYRIDDAYRFGDGQLRGETRIRLLATQDLASFNLDFLLPVDRVTVDGRPAVYDQATQRHELVITPKTALRRGDRARGGRVRRPARALRLPRRAQLAGERPRGRGHEPAAHGALVVPVQRPPARQGPGRHHDHGAARQAGHRQRPPGLADLRPHERVAYRWVADEPMVPYLAFFAAGRFEVSRGTQDGLPWLVAVSRQLAPSVRRDRMELMERTPEIVSWLETRLGDYPFGQTGGLTTSLQPGFSLENQTRPTYSTGHRPEHRGARAGAPVVRRLGLGARLARHLAQRGLRQLHGGGVRRGPRGPGRAEVARADVGGVPQDDPYWMLPIGDPGPENIFAWPVYTRGSMTLQALRHRVGESAFWTILRTWVADRAGGNGTTEEFQALAEQVSGRTSTGSSRPGSSPASDPRTPPPTASSRTARRPAPGPAAEQDLLDHPGVQPRGERPHEHPHQAHEPGVRLGTGADCSAHGHGGVEAHPQRDGGERQGEQDERDVPDAAVGEGGQGGEQGDTATYVWPAEDSRTTGNATGVAGVPSSMHPMMTGQPSPAACSRGNTC